MGFRESAGGSYGTLPPRFVGVFKRSVRWRTLRAATDCRPIVAPKTKAGVPPDTMEHATGLPSPLFLRDPPMVARGRVSRMPYVGLVDVSGDEVERLSGR